MVWKYGVRPYSTVPLYRTILTVSWPFGSNFGPKQFFVFLQQLVMNKTQIINQESSTASDFWVSMQAIAGPFPQADAAPTQPQGRSGKHCVASAHKRSMLEVGMGGDWGGEAFLRPFLHWKCQPPSWCSFDPASGSFSLRVGRTRNCTSNCSNSSNVL